MASAEVSELMITSLLAGGRLPRHTSMTSMTAMRGREKQEVSQSIKSTNRGSSLLASVEPSSPSFPCSPRHENASLQTRGEPLEVHVLGLHSDHGGSQCDCDRAGPALSEPKRSAVLPYSSRSPETPSR